MLLAEKNRRTNLMKDVDVGGRSVALVDYGKIAGVVELEELDGDDRLIRRLEEA